MFRTKDVEKIKTHILYCATFFENRAVYEIVWKGTVQPGRPQMTTIWRTHSDYAIVIAFPLQQKLHERALMLCLVNVS